MIHSLSVTNLNGETLKMELTKPMDTGLAIKNISGLGTPTYSINMTPYGYGDGSMVGNVKAESRNILIELWPIENPLVEDSRQVLYRYFQVKKPIILGFELDNRVVMIDGYVEYITPNIFNQSGERETVQISVLCPDPNYHEAFETESFIFGRIPMFEFPFENNLRLGSSEVECTPMGAGPSVCTEVFLPPREHIIMGEINLDNQAQIDYYAESDTGVIITIEVRAAPGDIDIYDVDTYEHIFISKDRVARIAGGELMNKDEVIISTIPGQRYVKLRREGIETNLLGAVNKDMAWFTLKQGPNRFSYTTSYEDASILISFQYRNTYAAI